MNKDECIKMYKTFVQPYFLYAIEVWGHSIQSDNDILVKLQSKILRILLHTHRSKDAWTHTEGHVKEIRELYNVVIKKLCMKHHFKMLPNNFSQNIMPDYNDCQLGKKISRISLEHMYDYQTNKKLSSTIFKDKCINIWNSLPFDVKVLPYLSGKETMHKALKIIK